MEVDGAGLGPGTFWELADERPTPCGSTEDVSDESEGSSG